MQYLLCFRWSALLLLLLTLTSLWPDEALAQRRRTHRRPASRSRSHSRSRVRRPAPVVNVFNTADLLAALDVATLGELARTGRPAAGGALGRNRPSYVHARFQAGITVLADRAARANDGRAVAATVLALTYAFTHQTAAGDFSLGGLPPPALAELAAANTAFLAAVGASLEALGSSPWLQTNPVLAPSRQRLEALRPAVKRGLHWLSGQEKLLRAHDAESPHRLWADAVALMLLGQWANDSGAVSQGRTFAHLALDRQASEGFFREGTGFDTEAQAKSLALAVRLLAALPAKDPLRAPLKLSVAHAAAWLATRVKASGELTTTSSGQPALQPSMLLADEPATAWVNAWVGLRGADAVAGGPPRYRALADRVRRHYLPPAPVGAPPAKLPAGN